MKRVGQLLLRVVTAAMLGLDAYVHLRDRSFYTGSRGGAISQGSLFVLEGAVASVAALLLILGWRVRVARRADWLVAFFVAASALAAVLLYRYVDVGTIGPFPDMYEPTWQVPGKLLSAYVEAGAGALSALGLALPPAPRSPKQHRAGRAAASPPCMPSQQSRGSPRSSARPGSAINDSGVFAR